MANSTHTLVLGGRCNLRCPVCDCWERPASLDSSGLPHAIRQRGERLVLRGEAAVHPSFAATVCAARERFTEVWVRTNGQLFPGPAAARRLREWGARGVIVPLFSHLAEEHDRIAGRQGAHAAALQAARVLAGEGLLVSVESPLLPPHRQDLGELVRQAFREAGQLAGARFYVPIRAQPEASAPPRWSEARGSLLRALAACRALSVPVAFSTSDGIPVCVLGHEEEHQALSRFDPRRPAGERPGFSQGAPCAECALAPHCLGVTDAYRGAHGDLDLRPFRTRPRRMIEQRTTPHRVWTDEQRQAARSRSRLVLRPTVNCNQDCPFCSANETSENQHKKKEMLRRISRAARMGITHLSFSGGEPTLSPDLVGYIRAAKRLGIPRIELVTNGVLLDGPEKVRPLVEAGLTSGFVSLHAHDETLSRRMTSKIGEWERTVRAVDAFAGTGIWTCVNHVITRINFPYLPRFARFVADRWEGRVSVSFAFVTPQFKALEHPQLMPQYTEVLPWLRRAMRILADRRVQFIVGSRQGIPPCMLGPYQAWGDIFALSSSALSEDAPQKIRAPECDTCRYTRQCTGLWRPYVERYGLGEIRPVVGPPWTEEEIRAMVEWPSPFGWDDMPAPLRATPPEEDLTDPEPPPPRPALAVVQPGPVRQESERLLRVAMLGSGPQAQRLAVAMAHVPGLVLAGVASPHLLDRPPGFWADVPRFADPAALFAAVSPDAVIVAAATIAHHPLTLAAAERGLPVLVEKPLAQTRAQATELAALAKRILIVPAHAMLFAPGVRTLAQELASERVIRASVASRTPPQSPEAPASWSREALFQALYRAVYLLGAVTRRCDPTLVSVEARGAARPEWVRAVLAYPGGVRGEVVLDYQAAAPGVELFAATAGERRGWRRNGSEEMLVRSTPGGERSSSPERGSDTESLLAAFRDAVRAGGPPPVSAKDALDTMVAALAVVDALGRSMARPGSPRHAASPGMVVR